jgi:superfamily II DNA helicase RecQ
MENSQDLIILTSPPASGKTYWIETFFNSGITSLIIVSPLRALKDECQEKWAGAIKVVTPEEWMMRQEQSEIVIFDEFHLNYYWGDTFRPVLWEAFYALSSEARLTILLTATLSQEMIKELSFFSFHFEDILWCDYGNQKLKYSPSRYIKSPSRKWISHLIACGPRGKGVNLIFCPYRQEVFEWEKSLKLLGYKVWSCVGGEARYFKDKMKSAERPDFIVATSVLSHGVNLPSISCVYFLYPLSNIDFWIQMVARGGRKGESYEVFALESPHGIKWNRWINYLAILPLGLKIQFHQALRECSQWFLRESS